jgi:hypothetical protein
LTFAGARVDRAAYAELSIVRRVVPVWSWILAGGLLAATSFAGFGYYRIWGPRVISYALGEVLFFAALAGLVALALGVFRVFPRSKTHRAARTTEDSRKEPP